MSGALSREVQDGRGQQHLLLILIPENLGGWFKRTLLGFVFAVEANSVITLESDFSGTQTLIKRLYGSLEPLGEELACILFQLPRSMKKDTPFLKAAISQMDVVRATS